MTIENSIGRHYNYLNKNTLFDQGAGQIFRIKINDKTGINTLHQHHMDSFDSTHLLESVAKITREQDSNALEKVMLDTFCDRLGMDAACLLKSHQKNDHSQMKISSSSGNKAIADFLNVKTNQWNEEFVVIHEDLRHCMDSRQRISAQSILDSSNYYAWPILCNSHERALLITSYTDQKHGLEILNAFIDIYSNFLTVIDNGQRDTLTGLLNRKTFDFRINEILSTLDNKRVETPSERRHNHEKKQYWLAMLDIDKFKSINDNFGHLYGDEVLLIFAELMKDSFRSRDVLFRYGGEEFVAVLAPATEKEALLVFNRFRKNVEAFEFPQVGRVTVSIGVVEMLDQHPTRILEDADKALYYAKSNGRNQTCSYSSLLADGKIQQQKTNDDIELF